MSFGNITGSISQITNIETFLNNKNTALVSPKTSPGISGFVFDIPESETVSLTSDITDNYTESNSFLNDHRIIKPIRITLNGFIGELVVKQEILDLIIETLQSGLTTLNAYLGDFTNGMQQNIQTVVNISTSAVSRVNQLVNRVQNIVEGFNGEGPYQNKQQRAYYNLEALFKSETVLTVQTPWRYYDNMLIETLEFTQDESEFSSSISVTLKEMRFAEIGVISYKNNLDANRNELQSKETEDTGKIRGNRNSFLFDATTAVTGGF
jgi:hypothetical protein